METGLYKILQFMGVLKTVLTVASWHCLFVTEVLPGRHLDGLRTRKLGQSSLVPVLDPYTIAKLTMRDTAREFGLPWNWETRVSTAQGGPPGSGRVPC